LGIALHNYHDVYKILPPGYRFKPGSATDGVGTANVSLLPYIEQSNAQNQINPNVPWYLLTPADALMQIATFRCPSDTASETHTYPWVTAMNVPVGDTFANSSYAYSLGYNDAYCFGSGFGPRPVTDRSGVFAIHSTTRLADILDGTSNTFAIGEAASGFTLCTGIGCTSALPGEESTHGWLVGGATLDIFYSTGLRYTGSFASTFDRLNKSPVTDSLMMVSGNSHVDCRPSDQGGVHWSPNFRSLHPGGANFLFCDGSVQYLNETIDMMVYRGLSTIQGGEVVSFN
jgi:prepilin-type processing-associated H-X9-DG protein